MNFSKSIKLQRGFTLIEIIIALGIVSVAVVAIVDAMGKHTNAASQLEGRILASWIASNHIAEIRHESKTDRVKLGSKSEVVKMGGQRWRVRSKIDETEVERVFLVEVEVKDDKRRNEKPLAVMTTGLTDRL